MLATCVIGAAALIGGGAHAQDLPRQDAPPPPAEQAADADSGPVDPDQVQFSAATLEYDMDGDVVTASGDVRMVRRDDRLRADQVVWNRKTGQVVATGNIAVTNPQGDTAYGDRIDLTDSLRDGVVENMLIVLEQGGRLAARRGTRDANGVATLEGAAYTPCAVTSSTGCPKEPTWKISAVRVTYRPDKRRVYYQGARLDFFGLGVPLPAFSHPIGSDGDSGFLAPDIRYDRTNGIEIAVPYHFQLARNRAATITPHLFSDAMPMLEAEYREINRLGAFRLTGYGTVSRRSDDFIGPAPPGSKEDFRGYLDAAGRYQLDPNWSVSGSIRLTTDDTFLRRYDISRDDRLRNTIQLERIDRDSYFSLAGWAVQTLRVDDQQGMQPIALPEIDYRRRVDGLFGGTLMLQANSLALTRTEGQDTQRAFAGARWDLRKLTRWGQEVTFTAYARGDLYNTSDTLATTVAAYRGESGFNTQAIGAVAVDVKWPLVGEFLGGTQRLTPRVQVVAAPHIANLDLPNEDARAVDLEDSNLFALNRFAGYDRFEDSTRFTYGLDYTLSLPGISIDTNIGQSYRLTSRPSLFPDGTGLNDRFSDYVGRTEIRYREFVSLVHRFRIDKDNFAFRRNEIDATIGSRRTYVMLGYLRLNRNITEELEDLRDREEARVGARVQVSQFWSVFGSAIVDLTGPKEDPLSAVDGFEPVRHRLGVAYEDDCLKLGVTWRRDYEDTGDARRGNTFLLTLRLKNLGG
nr:LPS assembly protein LptD [Hephaestia sp. MAHUQ-44]